MPESMEVSNPRRILLLGPPEAGHLELLKELTGSQPDPTTPHTLTGLSHTLSLKTPYYTASIPIWLDEISPSAPGNWSSDFLLPEAKEVLQAIGAFILVFRKPIDDMELSGIRGLLREVGRVVKEGCGDHWDGVVLAVGMKQDVVPNLGEIPEGEGWEVVCRDEGFEWVDGEAMGKNEFGEELGVKRIQEALEANDWEGAGGEDSDGFDFGDLSGEDEADAAEMRSEMAGMKQAIYGGGVEDQDEEEEDEETSVEQLEAMMLKMQSIRDMGADLPEAERKRFAAKAVNDIMKTL